MIVLMKKVTVVTTDAHRDETLFEVGRLGVVHVFTEDAPAESTEHLDAHQLRIERALTAIPADGDSADGEQTVTGSVVDEVLADAEKVNELLDERSAAEEEKERTLRELERQEIWQGIEPAELERLEAAGVSVNLYNLPTSVADAADLPNRITLFRDKNRTVAVSVLLGGDEFPKELTPVEKPTRSDQDLRGTVDAIQRRLREIDTELATWTPKRTQFEAALVELDDDIEFVRVGEVMDRAESLVWLTGFAPVDRVDAIRKAAADAGWGLVIRDPEPEEHVPTEVENPKPVRIIQPVFSMLGTVPGYRELDISFWFLAFFTVFFAMIIGDGGYGLILTVGGVYGMIRTRAAGKRMSEGLILLMVLSVATVVWGAITGNWFGYEPFSDLPVLRSLVIPAIDSFETVSAQSVQLMCFILGTVQLSIAHGWGVIRRLTRPPRLVALAELGMLVMVLGLFWLVLQLVLDIEGYTMPQWALPMILSGFAAALLFGALTPGENVLIGMLKGVANVIPTALDGVSAFSDIISYIRLYAVGLASLAIAQSFNGMASGIADGTGLFGAVAAAVVLILGHTLNLAMGALAVVVHGVRLNMLEFSGHLGMEWTGVAYAPFRTRNELKEKNA